jgi:hypothetical protein
VGSFNSRAQPRSRMSPKSGNPDIRGVGQSLRPSDMPTMWAGGRHGDAHLQVLPRDLGKPDLSSRRPPRVMPAPGLLQREVERRLLAVDPDLDQDRDGARFDPGDVAVCDTGVVVAKAPLSIASSSWNRVSSTMSGSSAPNASLHSSVPRRECQRVAIGFGAVGWVAS